LISCPRRCRKNRAGICRGATADGAGRILPHLRERDPEKRVPVFGQDHVQRISALPDRTRQENSTSSVRPPAFIGSENGTRAFHALARWRSRANDWPMKRGRRKHRPQFDQRVGKEGQLSNPEQNEMVAEAAGPSQHLLPASSKAASGTSKLSVSSSYAVTNSVMLFILSSTAGRHYSKKNSISNSLFDHL